LLVKVGGRIGGANDRVISCLDNHLTSSVGLLRVSITDPEMF